MEQTCILIWKIETWTHCNPHTSIIHLPFSESSPSIQASEYSESFPSNLERKLQRLPAAELEGRPEKLCQFEKLFVCQQISL